MPLVHTQSLVQLRDLRTSETLPTAQIHHSYSPSPGYALAYPPEGTMPSSSSSPYASGISPSTLNPRTFDSPSGSYYPQYPVPAAIVQSHSGGRPYGVRPERRLLCEWNKCHLPLQEISTAGIARHLEQYHGVPVTDNRTRRPCLWGKLCRHKDMYPISLGKHIVEYHGVGRAFRCPQCGADFAYADVLSRHMNAFCPSPVSNQGLEPIFPQCGDRLGQGLIPPAHLDVPPPRKRQHVEDTRLAGYHTVSVPPWGQHRDT
ncbi:hypothetical protein C8Q79DRAFT_272327 [Trametes meyenii]|nr:hypothetical protein C8Q79DRAFT_272327 [Trametes meyenii]